MHSSAECWLLAGSQAQSSAQQRLPLTPPSLGGPRAVCADKRRAGAPGLYSCPVLQDGGDVSGGLHPDCKAGARGLLILQLCTPAGWRGGEWWPGPHLQGMEVACCQLMAAHAPAGTAGDKAWELMQPAGHTNSGRALCGASLPLSC